MEVTLSMADVLYFAGAITVIAAALNWIVKGVQHLKKPNKNQDQKIQDNQDLLQQHTKLLANDDKRLKQLEEQGHLEMQALLALLEHSLDGNNSQRMKEVKNEIQKYLIEK